MFNELRKSPNIYPASSPVIEGHLPTEVRRKPAQCDLILNNLQSSLTELHRDLLLVEFPKKDVDSMPNFRDIVRVLIKVSSMLTSYEEAKKAPLSLLQVFFRSFEEPLRDSKIKNNAPALKSIRKVNSDLDELLKLLSRDKPTTKEFKISIIGSKQDIGSLSKELKDLALKLILDAQTNSADDHRWSTVKGKNGEIIRFVAPLGSGKEPVKPPIDPDSIDALRELTERLYEAAKIPFAALPTL